MGSTFTSFGQSINPLGLIPTFPGTVTRVVPRGIKSRPVLQTTPSNLVFGAVAMLVEGQPGGTASTGGYWQPLNDFLAAPQVVTTGATTNTSPSITVASVAGIVLGMVVTGTGMGSNATVIGINPATLTVLLNVNATATNTGVTLTFAIPTGNAALVASQYAGIAKRIVQTNLTFPQGQVPGVLQLGYYAPGDIADVMYEGSIGVIVANGTPVVGQPVYARLVANSAVAGTAVGDIEAGPLVASDVISTTMGMTIGANTMAVASPTNIAVGQVIAAAGIPVNSVVLGISSSTVTFGPGVAQATAASGVAVTFSNLIALPDTVFSTGYQDSTNTGTEITIERRRTA
jgi:hypothetical protein